MLDAQLPPALAARISALGHAAFHMTEKLPANADDDAIAREANGLGVVLVSKDEDFVDLSLRGILEVPLLWIRSGNMTTRRIWALLEPLLPDVVRAIEAGDRIVEVR